MSELFGGRGAMLAAGITVLILLTIALALVWRTARHRGRGASAEGFEPDELQQLLLSTLLHYYPGVVPLDLLHQMIIAARPDLPGNLGGQDRTRRELERLQAARLVRRTRGGAARFGLTERGRDRIAVRSSSIASS